MFIDGENQSELPADGEGQTQKDTSLQFRDFEQFASYVNENRSSWIDFNEGHYTRYPNLFENLHKEGYLEYSYSSSEGNSRGRLINPDILKDKTLESPQNATDFYSVFSEETRNKGSRRNLGQQGVIFLHNQIDQGIAFADDLVETVRPTDNLDLKRAVIRGKLDFVNAINDVKRFLPPKA